MQCQLCERHRALCVEKLVRELSRVWLFCLMCAIVKLLQRRIYAPAKHATAWSLWRVYQNLEILLYCFLATIFMWVTLWRNSRSLVVRLDDIRALSSVVKQRSSLLILNHLAPLWLPTAENITIFCKSGAELAAGCYVIRWLLVGQLKWLPRSAII